jgi:hypothetical protein
MGSVEFQSTVEIHAREKFNKNKTSDATGQNRY